MFLIVVADQQEVAGRAQAYPGAIDDLFGNRYLVRPGIDIEESVTRGDEEFALGRALDARARAGHDVKLEDARGVGFQRAAVDVDAGHAKVAGLLLQQPGAGRHLGKVILEMAQVDLSVGQDRRRVIAMQGAGLLLHCRIRAGAGIDPPRDVDALVAPRRDGGAHGVDVDPAAHAFRPHRGDEFVRIQLRRFMAYLPVASGQYRLSGVVLGAVDGHVDNSLQPCR